MGGEVKSFTEGAQRRFMSNLHAEMKAVRERAYAAVFANVGDADETLLPDRSANTQYFDVPLTAERTVELSEASARNGSHFSIVRTANASGAFGLNVRSGSVLLKTLTAGQWCEVGYDGSAWMLTAFGAL